MKIVRVLLVEDEPAARVLMEDFFAARKDMVLCASARDGQEGLALVEQEQPDVVLLDLIMPGLDGLGFLQMLRQHPPARPPAVLVVSRAGDQNVIRYALSLGARYYLMKPLNFDMLPLTIRGLCAETLVQSARTLLQDMGGAGLGLEAASSAAAALAEDTTGKLLLKQAYAPVISANSTSYECVEKNIRDMVRKLHEAGGPGYCALMGGLPERRPSNDVFLRRLAKKLFEK